MRRTFAALMLLTGFVVLVAPLLSARSMSGAADLAAPGLAYPAQSPSDGPGLSADVVIGLSPSTLTVAPNQIFTLDIVVNSGSQLVDGAQASISFDPSILAVVDAAGNPVSQIIEGTAFSTHIMNTADNSTGRIFYADGQLTGDPLSGAFSLAAIRFKAKIAGVSAVAFITDQNPQTKVTLQGANVLTAAQNGSVTVGTPGATATPTRAPTRTRTPTAQPTTTATATRTTPPAGPVIRLAPPTGAIGQDTLIEIVVDAGSQPVDGAQAFLNFSPTYLRVVDSVGNASASIIAGSAFDTVIMNSVDNSAGHISFAAGMLSGSPRTGTFTLATIRFKGLSTIASTTVQFSILAPRQTKLTYQGANLLDAVVNGAYSVSGSGTPVPRMVFLPVILSNRIGVDE